jgi:hypothetical protein
LIDHVIVPETKPRNATPTENFIAKSIGGLVGAVTGGYIAYQTADNNRETFGKVFAGGLLGAGIGGFMGWAIVNRSMEAELVFDPGIPDQRRSLASFAKNINE